MSHLNSIDDDSPSLQVPKPEPYPNTWQEVKPLTYPSSPVRKLEKQLLMKHESKQLENHCNFNFGNPDKIQTILESYHGPDEQSEALMTASLNSTRILQTKLRCRENERFQLPIDKDEIPKDDNDKAPKTLNFTPIDRVFGKLPSIQSVKLDPERFRLLRGKTSGNNLNKIIETEEDAVESELILQKRKVKKQVDSKYLKHIEKHKPILEDLLFIGM